MSTSKRIAKRLIAVVLTVMMLMSMVTIGISSVSAASVELAPTGADIGSGHYIYFDNSLTKFSQSKIQVMVGHSSYSICYEMTKLANTDLYYVKMPSWSGATQLAIIGASSVWGGEEGSSAQPNTRKGWAPENTAVYSLGTGLAASNVTFLVPAAAGNGSKLNAFVLNKAYSTMNTAQSAVVKATTDGTTFADNADAGTVTVASYYLSSGKTSATATTASGSVNAVKTANVTMTAAANEGYTFLGWSTDGTSVTSADATYTYTCDGAAKTVYALFETAAEESSSSSTGEVESQPTTTTPGTSDPEETNGTAMDASAWFDADGLYAYASVATGDELGADAWQRWDNVSGHSANRYIYLPASASDTEVVIYNNYSDYVELNGVKIDAGCYAIVPYVNGTTYKTSGATTQTVKIMKSDAEGTLFINSADGMTTKNDAGTKSTVDAEYDLYSFMTSGSKNQEAAWAAGAVADADGVDEIANTVKKIKGRGNSTWNLSKKPFNITYDTKISVDGMAGKKWSLLANAQDPSLLRNRLVYDLANEVNMTYACDSRFVDWFVNGDYKGSYQLTQKIEMGKNTVMPDLEEPEVEDVVEDDGTITPYPKADFDFILELDTKENAESSGDRGFTTTKGQWMTFKTPDDPADEQYNFMVEKYQAVETALYSGDIAELEKLVNLDDFARAYLINEVAKNLDAGVTSCYFTYNSETGMFTTAPVWDYDNALGNSKSIEGRHDADGNMLDVSGPTGWYARDLMHYAISNTLNVFGQACATTTTNAAGETFNDVVLRIWNDEFMPALAVLEGTAEAANDRLNTVAGYMANLKDSGQWNYDYAGWDLTANNGWVCDHSSLVIYDYDAEANTYTTSTKSYDQYTLDGQANYAGDWLVSRMNWMAAQYNEAETVVPDGYIRIYFENNWKWPDACIHIWGSELQDSTTWPGMSLTNVVGQNSDGYDIYEIIIPEDATGIVFNGTGEYGAEQSADITGGWYEGICYYMTYDSATNTKPCGSYDYKVPEETTTAPAETTTAPAESSSVATTDETDPTETTTAPAETTTAPAAETMTIYFENNWKWTNLRVYWWGSKTGTNPAWNAQKMEYVDTTEDGYDRYVIEVPSDITGLIFNGTSSTSGDEQCADITGGWYDGICYYMTYDSATNTKPAKSYTYEPIVEESSSTPAESSSVATTDETDPTETTTAPAETTTAPAAETMTIYFENNWNWPDLKIYWWGSKTGENPAWNGLEMTYVDKQSDGYSRYVIEVPTDIEGMLFNGTGEYGAEQSADITEGWYDGICYYMTYDSATNTKPAKSYTYEPIVEETTTTPVESTPATADETDPVESTPAATTDETEPSIPDMPTVITVYAINSAKWEEVYAYCWADSPAVAWPGVAMDKTEDTVNGFDVYALSFDSAYVNVIFNNNDKGAQTADLTAMDGQYYDIKGAAWYASLEDVPALDTLSTDRYIVGEFNGWSTTANEFKLKAEGESYGYVTLTLEANKTYEFKVIREGAWTSCTTPVTGTVAGLQFSSSNSDNCTITTTDAGEYVFAFGLNDSKLNVTYPGSEVITPTTPDEEETDTTVKLAGDFTEWGTNAIEMTADENGTVYTTELRLEAGTYEFKMIEFGKWLGNNGSVEDTCEGWTFRNGTDDNGNEYGNCTLVATGGTYTFTFDTTTDKLTITAVLDEIPATVYDVNWPVDNGLYTVNAPATADEGSVIEFTVDAVEGYTVAGVIVNMEEVYADENGVYTWTVTENVNIMAVVIDGSITPDEPTEYNVYASESEYYTVNAPATVEANGTLTFTIDVADDYVIDYVIVNMVEVYANDANEYVFEDVTEDVEILVYVSEDTSDDTPVVYQEFPVMFVDYDNSIIATQMVKNGELAVAPAAPERTGYTFTGWSEDLSVPVTKALLVVAEYKKNASDTPAPEITTGSLKVEVAGGTGFTISIDGGTARPQGTSYLNANTPIGATITLTATTTNDNEFMGWVNPANGLVVSTELSYTFRASGNDFFKAMYKSEVEGVQMVAFYNDKSNQYLDIQYYNSTDEIVFVTDTIAPGYDFKGWKLSGDTTDTVITADAIKSMISAGEDVIIVPIWKKQIVYITLTVINGTITGGTGSGDQYQANTKTTVTANNSYTADGKTYNFAYWVDGTGKIKSYSETYSFYPKADMTIEAVFVAEGDAIDYQVLVSVDDYTDRGNNVGMFSMSWYVPEEALGLDFEYAGLVAMKADYYNGTNLYHGSTDANIYDKTSTRTTASGSFNWAGYFYSGEEWVVRAWVQYVDASGELVTEYSDVFEMTIA